MPGFVLGDTDDVPARVSTVRKVLSGVRYFDERLLELYRWVSERYLVPLAVAIDRGIPPRVVSEEPSAEPPPPPASVRAPAPAPVRVRPEPGTEADAALEAVRRALDAARSALVLVPEAEGGSHLARRLQDELGDLAATFIGGEPRERYRTWLRILAGRHRVVIGTRPAVFAPLPDLGLIWVDREPHAGHREPRSPSWHVRDLALRRGAIEGAGVVISGPLATAELLASGVREAPRDRARERARWPVVETVKPGPEGRAPRLVAALRAARTGFLLSSRPGYGVARVCRSCGRPAACARCTGVLEQRKGSIVCSVCGAVGVCASCGASDFGVQRRGAERVAEWAASLAAVPVAEADGPPEGERIAVGTPGSVPDAGPQALDVVGILDADPMLLRPGLSGQEQVLATWLEAAGWARPRPHGRVIVETTQPGHPAVQALVRRDPDRFVAQDAARRAEAGFPPGHPVFRVACTAGVAEGIEALEPHHLLVSGAGDERLCLVTVSPGDLDAFVARVREWARSGEVRRVEAEPHL